MELGIDVTFDEVDHPEGLTGDALLEQAWMDGDYCYIDTKTTVW